jgi:hypothetical protein
MVIHELTPAECRDALTRTNQGRLTWWLPATSKLVSGHEHASPAIYRIRLEHGTGRRTAGKSA